MVHDVLVTIKEGSLRGVVNETENGFNFLSFMGVPFAKAPVGELKFKAPQPAESWEGILEADKENNSCLSQEMFTNTIVGDFDCLYLNVYTPELPQENVKTLKPVMVWIHGGAFTTGSKNRDFYGPDHFMDKGVVVVSINYRLGSLGFLSLKDPKLEVSGNAGLKDQVMALKWVQRNIESFGGDPNNVTLFGESAGAASVSYHLLSPMSRGLFQKAVLLSGVATCSWAEGHIDLAKEIMKGLGKTDLNEGEMLALLENATKEELIAAQLKVPDIWKASEHRFISPTVETSSSEERFLPDSPMNLLKSGNYNKVPVILGGTSNEGLFVNLLLQDQDLKPANDIEYVPYHLNNGSEKASQIGKRIRQFYYGEQTPNDQNQQCYIDFVSDVFFLTAICAFAEDLTKTSNNNVYLYNFDMVTNLNKLKQMFNMLECRGASHGEDIFYIFKTMLSPPLEVMSQEYEAIQRMTTWFTNFAKYSDPNGKEFNPLLGVQWPPATRNMEYLNISASLTIQSNFGKKTADFWKSIEKECN